jgi:ribosome-associated protein
MANDKKKSLRAAPARKKKPGGAAAAKTKKKTAAKKPAPRSGRAPAKKKPKVPARAASRPAPVAENPEAQQLARRISELVLEKKARDVVILDVRGIASYADYVVLGSGDSDRQVTAMAENVLQILKREQGPTLVGAEGFETGQWVLIDYGDVVVHLFFEEVRGHYDLEGLWADAPREKVA